MGNDKACLGCVGLIVVIVILAGTIGFFAMQQGTPEAAPTVSLSVEDVNYDSVGGDTTFTLYHNGGDSLVAGDLSIQVGGDPPSHFFTNDPFEDGDSESITVSGEDVTGETFTLVHNPTDSVLIRTELD